MTSRSSIAGSRTPGSRRSWATCHATWRDVGSAMKRPSPSRARPTMAVGGRSPIRPARSPAIMTAVVAAVAIAPPVAPPIGADAPSETHPTRVRASGWRALDARSRRRILPYVHRVHVRRGNHGLTGALRPGGADRTHEPTASWPSKSGEPGRRCTPCTDDRNRAPMDRSRQGAAQRGLGGLPAALSAR